MSDQPNGPEQAPAGGPSQPGAPQPGPGQAGHGQAPPPPPPPGYGYQQPGYPQPGAYQPGAYPPGAQKSKIVAGILGILLGGLGIHRFYLGYTGIGVAQVVVTLLTCGLGAVWGLIEGILILVGSTITHDARGVPLSDA